jgi:hypothetical protein
MHESEGSQLSDRGRGGKHTIETVIMMADGERGWRVAAPFIRPEQ